MRCEHCGAEQAEGKFCDNCGRMLSRVKLKTKKDESKPSERSGRCHQCGRLSKDPICRNCGIPVHLVDE